MITQPAESTPTRQQFAATVSENVQLCREHYRLRLILRSFPKTEPGQFIQVCCRETDLDDEPTDALEWEPGQLPSLHGRELSSPLAMLRRPFSLAGRSDDPSGVELTVIHRVVGVGTEWLSRVCAGDPVSIIGPLGNRFELPPAGHMAVLVGGGVGIPPMLYLASRLSGRPAIAFCGATTRDLMPLTVGDDGVAQEFARFGVESAISTDDGSLGFRGFITQALEQWLEETKMQRKRPAASGGPSLVIYTCGPEPMMKRVAEIALARGVPCQVAVERAMACGMGTCQSCCIRVRKADPSQPPLAGRDWCYRLACTDGPIFNAADLLW